MSVGPFTGPAALIHSSALKLLPPNTDAVLDDIGGQGFRP
jgi:hypothetical protein